LVRAVQVHEEEGGWGELLTLIMWHQWEMNRSDALRIFCLQICYHNKPAVAEFHNKLLQPTHTIIFLFIQLHI
jgi:hypothetical protein